MTWGRRSAIKAPISLTLQSEVIVTRKAVLRDKSNKEQVNVSSTGFSEAFEKQVHVLGRDTNLYLQEDIP